MPAVGEICWLEVPCNDVARVASFYTAVLGWQSADPASSPPRPGALEGADAVHMFTSGKLSGAFVKMGKPEDVAVVADAAHPAKSAVLAYYYVASIEETLKKVEEAGGRVHVYVFLQICGELELTGHRRPKTAIAGGSMGHFARFIDTEGNLQGIWAAPSE